MLTRLRASSSVSLVITSALLGVASAAFAQQQVLANVPVHRVEMGKSDILPLDRKALVVLDNAGISEALRRLTESSGVNVAFSPSETAKFRRSVSCDCEDVTVREALDQILQGTKLSYMALRGQVLVYTRPGSNPSPFAISPRLALVHSRPDQFSLGVLTRPSSFAEESSERAPTPSVARDHIVTGRVTSSELAPLLGVNVVVKGTTIGTITNAAGLFSIDAPNATDTLVVSALGYRTQEVGIDGRSTINVVLEASAVALEGIVVVGYGSQAREVISGSVSAISAEEISRTSATTSADALVGKIQGINTRMPSSTMSTGTREARDGRPGGATTLQIRNMGEPLFVIDGVPVTPAEFNHLNSADIENISILKDASASVYGFRASNGVVLVTTRRGKPEQRPQLRVDGYYGRQTLHRTSLPHGYGNTAYQHKYAIVESEQNLGDPRSMTPDELESWKTAPTYEQWPLVINNQGAMQANLNVNLSGGSSDATYYLSLGHVNQDYVMKDNNFNRTNLQANLRGDLFEGFTIGSELRSSLETHLTTASGASSDPVQGIFRAIIASWPHEDPWANGNPDYVHGNVRYLIRSPAVMNRTIGGTRDQYRRTFAGNFWVEYTLPFGLSARGTFSRTYFTEQFDYHGYDIEAYCYDAATDTYDVCATVNAAERQHARELRQSEFAQLQLSQNLQLGNHNLSGVVAYEQSGGERRETELRAVPPTKFSHLLDLVDVNNLINEWGINRRASYIGRFNYDYKQKYLLEVLGRYDGSYLYAPDRRWGFFPGISAGWRLTEEPFLQNALGFFDELKLRASWGEAGREQGISDWGYLGGASYGVGGGSVFDGVLLQGVRPRDLAVTNLSWVTSVAKNIGIDFALFDGKLSGEFDVFERRLTGLPAARYDVLLPAEVGYNLPNENLNSEANRGVEGIVRYTDRVGRVTYTIAPNFTLSREKVLDIYKPRYGNSWDQYRTGTEHRWTGIRFDYQVEGQFQTMEEIANHPVDHDGQANSTLLPGDWIYKDVNRDGIINGLDMRPIGWGQGGTPILSYGMSSSASLGAFTLSLDVAGGSMFSYLPMNDVRLMFNTDHASGAYHQSRWRRADPYDDNSEWIPGRYPPLRKFATSHSSNRTSDANFLNVTFLRVRRVELGYNVPMDLASKVRLSNVRLYASASNPWWIDNNREWVMDPEASVANVYPTSSVTNVGFSATVGGATSSQPAVPVAPVGTEDD